MIQLNATETAQRLPYADLVPAIAQAAQELADGALLAPERLALDMGPGSSLLCMPAVGSDLGITKIVTVHRQNAALGLPAIQGEVIVFEVASGRRLMMLDGPTLTARRTAAVTLLAIQTLAPRLPRTALLIGTGVQASAHAQALAEYFDIRSFQIAGTTLASAEQFCDRLRATNPAIRATPLMASTLDASAVASDIVIALTTSKAPVIPAELPDETLAIGVGAFRPEMAELPPALLKRRRLIVDYIKGARHEAGDFIQAKVDWHDVTELSQHLQARPFSAHGGCVFKSVGHSSWDLAAARVATRAE